MAKAIKDNVCLQTHIETILIDGDQKKVIIIYKLRLYKTFIFI